MRQPLPVLLPLALLLAGNIRAPLHIPRSPSQALSPAGATLTVDAEDLRFTCRPATCAVTAVYAISARSAGSFAFRFISPSSAPARAVVAGAEASVSVHAVPSDATKPAAMPLFEARFSAAVPSGVSTISVTYDQPLGLYETAYGYVRPSAYAYELVYELWPLNEWTRSPDFVAKIAVDWPDDRPGVLGFLLGPPALECYGYDHLGVDKIADSRENRFEIRGELPRELRCLIDAPSSAKDIVR